MKEDFLHFVWQYQLFEKGGLKTTKGLPVHVFATGSKNVDEGPDFLEAKVMIDEMEWVGHVELHVKSSDWAKHRHQRDNHYDNVVLHVVWEDDKPIARPDGTEIPTLVMQNLVDFALLKRYEELMKAISTIPCEGIWDKVPSITKLAMLERSLMERLEEKACFALQILKEKHGDWETVTFYTLAKNFGFKVNAEPFYKLAQRIPTKILQKHRHNNMQLEALLFGIAGFLKGESQEDYFNLLKKEYRFLQHKYQLQDKEMELKEWRFLRMRPANFPTLRIAQLAALLHSHHHLFHELVESHSYKSILDSLQVTPSMYWQKHYHFGKPTTKRKGKLGKKSAENIIINTTVPLLIAFAENTDHQGYKEIAVRILEEMKPEANRITRLWNSLGIENKSAFDSQGLIQWYTHYCKQKKCAQCNVGTTLMQNG